MPVCAWMVPKRTIWVLPTNQAAPDVIMNRAMVVRSVRTPTFLLAFESPPVAKIQLPNRVFRSRYEATIVRTSHQMMAIWNLAPPTVTVLPSMLSREW